MYHMNVCVHFLCIYLVVVIDDWNFVSAQSLPKEEEDRCDCFSYQDGVVCAGVHWVVGCVVYTHHTHTPAGTVDKEK